MSNVGCSIGKRCIVGANSFVNSDFLDFSGIAGVPAKLVKRYDINMKKWVEVI